MGVVQHRQIKSYLEKTFSPHIDIADLVGKSGKDLENATLTRSLAAFAIAATADLQPQIASASVVDGFDDNGIDAIHYSAEDRLLYICQSKWSADGTGSVDLGSTEKFIRGIKDLLSLRFDRFNEKFEKRKKELAEAIDTAARIYILLSYSGSEKLGDHSKRILNDLLVELNDTGEIAYLEVISQEKLYSVVSLGGQGDPVNITVQLFDWGQTKTPYQAFYGQVAASDVAQWGAQYRQRIFSKNIRSFLGASTAVNEGIADSIRKAPNHFWYLNNGITVLCGSIKKRAIGGSSHEAGTFDCEHVAVVNGAQTVGTITELKDAATEQLAGARVPIRLISLEGCPPEFADDVTRATNTQNRVDSRNFVALDPEQGRLRSELMVDGVDYEYRQGEGEPTGEKRFGLVDATVALACSAVTPDLAVQAKREISKLWEDLGRAPYKLMFNRALPGLRLWHLVQILRYVEDCLDWSRLMTSDAKRKSALVNGNRIVAHIVFNGLDLSAVGTEKFQIDELIELIDNLVDQASDELYKIISEDYEDAYLAHLFKNASKCRDIVARIGILKPDLEKIQRRRDLIADIEDDIPF
jgi:sugar-specific transcriptional regulator TrmB